MNSAALCFATKFAMNSESGVKSATTRAISHLSTSIMTSVLTMVTTPLNSCVNPRSKPSEISVTSVMTRLKISPLSCESIYERGAFCKVSIARLRMSRTVL